MVRKWDNVEGAKWRMGSDGILMYCRPYGPNARIWVKSVYGTVEEMLRNESRFNDFQEVTEFRVSADAGRQEQPK